MPIVNPGFEQPVLANDDNFAARNVPGWQIYDPSNLFANANSNYSTLNPATSSYTAQAPEGNNVGAIYLDNAHGSGVAGFSQTLSDVLTAGKTYTLRLKVGNPLPDESTGPGFPGYAVQLLAGGNLLAEDRNTKTIDEGFFENISVSYTPSANDRYLGQPLEIRLLNVLQRSGKEVGFDNVNLDVSIPNSILNPGFELPVIPRDNVVNNRAPGWELFDLSNVIDGSDASSFATFNTGPEYKEAFYPQGVPEGNQALGIFLTKPVGSGIVGLSQQLTTVLEPNKTYTLSFEVGNIAPNANFPDLVGFPGYAVQLLAGGDVVAQDVDTVRTPDGTFAPTSFSYTALANDRNLGKNLEIRLLNLLQRRGQDANFDNVRLDINPAVVNSNLKQMPPSFFDEAYYLRNYADVAAAVRAGQLVSGLEHFNLAGRAEGRDLLSPYYNEASYLQLNSDVASAVASGIFASGVQHFVEYGYYEGRYSARTTAGTGDLQAAYYQRYRDVAQAVGAGIFESAYAHYFQSGAAEGRIFFG